MAEHGVKSVTAICFVMYLYFVLGSTKDYIFKMGDAREGQIRAVIEGSNVTLICKENGADRATWHISSRTEYVGYTDLYNGQCIVHTNQYPSLTLSEFGCTESEYSIIINRIEAKDNGTWKCHMTKDKYTIATHSISIFIVKDEQPLSATTRTSTTIQMLSMTVINSKMADSTSRDAINTEGEFTGNSNSLPPLFSGSIIYAIAAIGAIIVLMVIVLVVTLLLRARTRSRRRVEENKPRRQDSPEGVPPGQENDHNVIDIGGDYAQVSDFSVRYKVVAENPVYETCDKEVSDVKLPDASASENVSDVNSVVKKSVASEADGESPKPSDPDGLNDIYSVVQKCAKSQAAED